MTKNIIWRLKEQPTSESLRELVKDGILTKEEAREILFSKETQEERDSESLKAEIKFLRETVERLSKNQGTKILEIIKDVEKPYYRFDWYRPYRIWCNADSLGSSLNLSNTSTTEGNCGTVNTANFCNIKTF